MRSVGVKENQPVSVSTFIKRVNSLLSTQACRIQGEVTSLNLQYGKAIYFSIKDKEDDALLNCMIWRSLYDQNGIDLKVGDEIVVTGVPELYAPRGSFSLKTQTLEYAGEGALKKSYEELKKKLETEGLLAESRKRPLPTFPKKIGVITSKAGVVIQDFTSNLGKYGFEVRMVDSRVEGKDAIHDLLNALYTMSKQDIEVLVIMRGGGSWESLQPFNTESVVRAVTLCKCPVLTGIGHDTDVTLVQMVADMGVSTPTAVAEALNDSWDMLLSALDSSNVKILSHFHSTILTSSRHLNRNTTVIKSFFLRLEKRISRITVGFNTSIALVRSSLRAKKAYVSEVSKRIGGVMLRSFADTKVNLDIRAREMLSKERVNIKKAQESFATLEKYIRVADPERNLNLGYSLSFANGKLIRSKADVAVGDSVRTKLSDGEFTSEIKKV